jgi:hypothetical protein
LHIVRIQTNWAGRDRIIEEADGKKHTDVPELMALKEEVETAGPSALREFRSPEEEAHH